MMTRLLLSRLWTAHLGPSREGRAKIGRNDSKGHVAGDLASARALRAVEADLMEHIHEQIDRCTDVG